MINIISYLIGFLITVPFIATILVYLIAGKVYQNSWKAVHKSVNWTTILYIFSVCALFEISFGSTYTGVVLVVLLASLAVIAIIQWKLYTEVVFRNVFKIFWRFSFLLFGLLYAGLVLYGIAVRSFF